MFWFSPFRSAIHRQEQQMYRLFRLSILGIVSIGGMSSRASADPQAISLPSAPIAMESLAHSDQTTLEALYRSASVGSLPSGPFAGRAIPYPGTRRGVRQSKLIGVLWKGKEFPDSTTMVNRLALGMHAVHADMYYGESWLDGRPTLVLDYANTSRLFGSARDEMREVAPGQYLGLTYVRK